MVVLLYLAEGETGNEWVCFGVINAFVVDWEGFIMRHD